MKRDETPRDDARRFGLPGQAPLPDRAVFRRVFGNGDGAQILDGLCAITLGRALGPDAGDHAIWHLEGQRALVLRILRLCQAAPASAHGVYAPTDDLNKDDEQEVSP